MSKFITLENLGIFKTKIEALIQENASLKPTNAGSTGQVLTKTESGCEWKTASTPDMTNVAYKNKDNSFSAAQTSENGWVAGNVAASSGGKATYSGSSIKRTIKNALLQTKEYTLNFPSKSGTFALTSDVNTKSTFSVEVW